eukprot:scaffold5692_cov74-Phaeocystis_antarctica.AAC.5
MAMTVAMTVAMESGRFPKCTARSLHAARGGTRISPRPLGSQARLGTPSCSRPRRWIRHAVSHSPRELRGHRSSSTRPAAKSIARREPRSGPYHQRWQRAAVHPRAARPAPTRRPRAFCP